MSGYFNGQSVERRSDTTRQLCFELGVAGAMSQVGQPGLTRSNFLCGGHCLRYAQVRRMMSSEERVQNHHVNASKRIDGFVGKLLGIGDISQVPDAISVNRDGAVR